MKRVQIAQNSTIENKFIENIRLEIGAAHL